MNLPRTADFRVGVLAGWKAGGTGSCSLGSSEANRMLPLNLPPRWPRHSFRALTSSEGLASFSISAREDTRATSPRRFMAAKHVGSGKRSQNARRRGCKTVPHG
jgi:hypothetical protein